MGVKVFDQMQKNASSATTYNLISNLSNEQSALSLGYDGKTLDALLKKQVSQVQFEKESERAKRKSLLKASNKQERPLPMRPEIVDKYLMGVMNSQGGQSG